MSPVTVELQAGPDGFNDDKDAAKKIREKIIMPTLAADDSVVIDFSKVASSTQSFVHALVGEALQRFREPALDRIQFKDCTPLIKGLVQLVVDYSLGGFRSTTHENGDSGRAEETVVAQRSKSGGSKRRTKVSHSRPKKR